MLDEESTAQQQQLLAIYRRTAAQLVRQAASFGGENMTPPNITNSLYEAREHIRWIKTTLRESGIYVDDLPDDEQPAISMQTESSTQIRGKGGVPVQGVIVHGGTINGAVVGINSGPITNYSNSPLPTNQSLSAIQAALEQAIDVARLRGAPDLADDLASAARSLVAASKAQAEGKAERHGAKVLEAHRAIEQIARDEPQLQPLAQALALISSGLARSGT